MENIDDFIANLFTRLDEKREEIKKTVTRCSEGKENILQELQYLDGSIGILEKSCDDGSDMSIKVLMDKKESLEKELIDYNKTLDEFTAKLRNYMIFYRKSERLIRDVCPHKNNVFDHIDYHKNEDYYRCTACGAVR